MNFEKQGSFCKMSLCITPSWINQQKTFMSNYGEGLNRLLTFFFYIPWREREYITSWLYWRPRNLRGTVRVVIESKHPFTMKEISNKRFPVHSPPHYPWRHEMEKQGMPEEVKPKKDQMDHTFLWLSRRTVDRQTHFNMRNALKYFLVVNKFTPQLDINIRSCCQKDLLFSYDI